MWRATSAKLAIGNSVRILLSYGKYIRAILKLTFAIRKDGKKIKYPPFVYAKVEC